MKILNHETGNEVHYAINRKVSGEIFEVAGQADSGLKAFLMVTHGPRNAITVSFDADELEWLANCYHSISCNFQKALKKR